MNYHLELKRLKEQYSGDPATNQAYQDVLRVFLEFVKTVDKIVIKGSKQGIR